MTNETEKQVISREKINILAEKLFPNLSNPLLISLALQFERTQK